MNKERTQQWNVILDITRNMLKAAQGEDWDTLVDLEVNRRDLLNNHFSIPAVADEVALITQGAKQILSIDKEIMEISQKQRDMIGEQLQEIGQNKRAGNAYAANSV